jgi:hypothetical protein
MLNNFPENTMIMLDTTDVTLKEKVQSYLMNPNIEVMVEFKKIDGSTRIMNCTTANDFITRFSEPKEPDLEIKKPRKTNDAIQCVFDMDKKSWRSFRWDSVVEIGISRFNSK